MIKRIKTAERKKGFTLAEVLITLMIIGVVAVLVIPPLVNKYIETQTVTALKKAYTTLSEAHKSIAAENDGDFMVTVDGLGTNNNKYYMTALFLKYMNVVKNCNTDWSPGRISGCFPNSDGTSSDVTELDGSSGFGDIYFDIPVLTADGIGYDFYINADCNDSSYTNDTTKNTPLYDAVCGYVWVDTDGPNKGLEKVGRDLFFFYVTKTGIYPSGAYPINEWYEDSCSTSLSGKTCAAKVLKENAINY